MSLIGTLAITGALAVPPKVTSPPPPPPPPLSIDVAVKTCDRSQGGCGGVNPDDATSCEHCGKPLKGRK